MDLPRLLDRSSQRIPPLTISSSSPSLRFTRLAPTSATVTPGPYPSWAAARGADRAAAEAGVGGCLVTASCSRSRGITSSAGAPAGAWWPACGRRASERRPGLAKKALLLPKERGSGSVAGSFAATSGGVRGRSHLTSIGHVITRSTPAMFPQCQGSLTPTFVSKKVSTGQRKARMQLPLLPAQC